MDWYRDRGLTKMVSEVLTKDKPFGDLKKGDTWTYEQITTHYYGGRIDIRDDSKEGYDGWDEYAVAPMHSEDWYAFYKFLDRLKHETVMPYDSLILLFEAEYGKKIRWADDIWYRCPECGMVTDLRETKDHIHKMDCGERWEKD